VIGRNRHVLPGVALAWYFAFLEETVGVEFFGMGVDLRVRVKVGDEEALVGGEDGPVAEGDGAEG
jgi:hypothetical protein